MPSKITQEEYIRRCKEKHGNKYDYSHTNYVNMMSYIEYVCPKHGIIRQNAKDHENGHGCPHCSREKAHFVRLSNKDEFIRKSREIHGDKYDYSKVEYYNNNTPVIIVCPKHGEFLQTPHSHKSGQGCPKCIKIGKEEFVRRAKEKFGDKYDYSKIDYIDFTTKVCIIHPKYGEFWQKPCCHLSSKSGYVGKEKKKETLRRKSRKEILEEDFFKSVKGRNYDYSETVINKASDKITIICQKHGKFKQITYTHMNGGICPECLLEARRYTNDMFIEKANSVHGNEYDYSKVDYKDSQAKVAIICHKKDILGNEHGVFWQKPNSHLLGHKCPKCNGMKKSTDLWIAEAKSVYPDGKYSFDKVDYKQARGKVIVTCNVHGDFETKAADFLRGHGCPKCQMSKLEAQVEKILQENNIIYELQKKEDWLKGMSFDFFIPSKNIAIECQGIQHYKEKEFFNKREGLKERVERDSRKRELCKENGIELIYFTEQKFKKYETSGNLVFTDVNKLIEYINLK